MARGLPPSSAYLGSDLPDAELRMPASAPAAPSPSSMPPPDPMDGEMEPWVGSLVAAGQRAGIDIDPAVLMAGPGDNPSEFMEQVVKPLQSAVTTDTEVQDLQIMMDQFGLLGQNLTHDPEGMPTDEPVEHASGKPGTDSMSFAPDRPGRY